MILLFFYHDIVLVFMTSWRPMLYILKSDVFVQVLIGNICVTGFVGIKSKHWKANRMVDFKSKKNTEVSL